MPVAAIHCTNVALIMVSHRDHVSNNFVIYAIAIRRFCLLVVLVEAELTVKLPCGK